LEAGYHSADWDGRDEKGVRVGAGVYFYRLFVNGNSVGDRRVTILR
jgi:flagellar hook assembly protein FlgD